MSPLPTRLLLATSLTLLPALAASDPAGPPQQDKGAERTDTRGDPLPKGALLRLGTARFRHAGDVWDLAFAPDGKSIFSIGNDWTARRFDVATGQSVELVPPSGREFPALYALAVGLSPEKRLLLVTTDYNTIHIRDAATGKPIHEMAALQLGVRAASFSPDGTRLATLWHKGQVRLWDVGTGKAIRDVALRGMPAEGATGVAYSPNGKLLAVSSWPDVHLCETVTGEEVRRLKAPEINTRRVAFSPDARFLFAGWGNGPVRQWNVSTGVIVRDYRADDNWVTSLTVSPDSKQLAIGDSKGLVRLWDVSTGGQVRTLGDPSVQVTALAFSPDGKTLAAAQGPVIRLWDMATGKEKGPDEGHVSFVRGVAFSPDGKTLASCGIDRRVLLWDATTGKQLHRLLGHTFRVDRVAFTPDGKTLVSSCLPTDALFWDVAGAKRLRAVEGMRPGGARVMAVAPDGKTLVVVDHPGVVLWDLATSKQLRRLEGPQSGAIRAVYSADGRLVVTLDSGGSLYVCDTDTGKEIRRFRSGFNWQHAGASGPHALTLSPDGRWLALAGDGIVVEVWEITTGQRCHRWRGDGYAIHYVAYSPDGRLLALRATRGEAARLREVGEGKEVAVLDPMGNGMAALAFSPDGGKLAVGRADGTVVLWPVPPPRPPAKKPSEQELRAWWQRLGGEDAEQAIEGIQSLAAASGPALPFLRRHLESVCRLPGESPSRFVWLVRLCAVLEQVGTAEARGLLQEVVRSAPDERVAVEARASLARLGRRPAR